MGNVSDEILLIALGFLTNIVLFVLILVLWSKQRKMKKKYMKMMNDTGIDNLQELITDIQQKLNSLKMNGTAYEQDIRAIKERMGTMKGNMAIQRYNAFHDLGQGSDMSFTLALLDDAVNGVVLTAIHSREETYVYGKPITNGESKYSLSPEEKQTIQAALNQS